MVALAIFVAVLVGSFECAIMNKRIKFHFSMPCKVNICITSHKQLVMNSTAINFKPIRSLAIYKLQIEKLYTITYDFRIIFSIF